MEDPKSQVSCDTNERGRRSRYASVVLHATLVALLVVRSVAVWAQSSSFTYQGQLQDDGNPAAGSYDLQFQLFDAPVGGNQVGSTQALEDVAVTAGLFTVVLDFGAGAFPGADRFLEIAVRPGPSTEAFSTLTPRQPVTATPYALQCLHAATAQNAVQLGGTVASQYVLTGDTRLTDARPPAPGSGNYVQNATAPQADSNFNISGNGVVGGNLTVNGALNASGAKLTDLNATNITTGALSGSRLAVPLELGGPATLGNGIITARNFADDGVGLYGQAYGSSGRIFGVWGVSDNPGGIGVQGTSAGGAGVQGSSALTGVSGVNYLSTGTGMGVFGVSYNSEGMGVRGEGFSNTGANYGVYGRSNSPTGIGVYGYSSNIAVQGSSPSGFAGYFDGKGYYSGNLGLGTTTPAARLHVEATSGDGIYAHNVSGYAIHARSEQNYAGYFEGYVYLSNQVFIPTLGPAGSTALCRNGSNAIATCSSSLRYKAGVESFAGGLGIVSRLRPIRFNWKDSGTPGIGFAAEEVAAVEPLLTFRNDAGEIEGVNYDELSAVFVNTFKELQAQITAQREQLDAQQRQIDSLKELVCAGNRQSAACATAVAQH